jgi:hypothetical protein
LYRLGADFEEPTRGNLEHAIRSYTHSILTRTSRRWPTIPIAAGAMRSER